jgi:hypothetical protein
MSRAGVNSDIAERCLGHVIAGVKGVYDRHTYLPEMLHAYEALEHFTIRLTISRIDEVCSALAWRELFEE